MSFSSVVQEFEAEFKALVAKAEAFFSHAKTVEPVASAPVEVPVVEVAKAPDVASVVVSPFPQNTTDPTAPGFVMPVEAPPVVVAPVVEDAGPDLSVGTMEFVVYANRNIVRPAGEYSITFVDCPPNVYVQTVNGAAKLTANGVVKQEDNPQALNRLTAQGPTVNVSVSAPNGTTLMVLRAPD